MSFLKLDALYFRPESFTQNPSYSFATPIHDLNIAPHALPSPSALALPGSSTHSALRTLSLPSSTLNLPSVPAPAARAPSSATLRLTTPPPSVTLATAHPHLNDLGFNAPLSRPELNLGFRPEFATNEFVPLPQQIQIKKNDSLTKLSKEYGVPASHIAAANQLDPKNLNFLREGATLKLPDTTAMHQPEFASKVALYTDALKVADAQYWQAQRAKLNKAPAKVPTAAPKEPEPTIVLRTKTQPTAQTAVFAAQKKKPIAAVSHTQPPQSAPAVVSAVGNDKNFWNGISQITNELKPSGPIFIAEKMAGEHIRSAIEAIPELPQIAKRTVEIGQALPGVLSNRILKPLAHAVGAAFDPVDLWLTSKVMNAAGVTNTENMAKGEYLRVAKDSRGKPKVEVAGPTQRMLEDVENLEDIGRGIKAIVTEPVATLVGAVKSISDKNDQVGALRDQGKNDEAARLQADLWVDVGSVLSAGGAVLYGIGKTAQAAGKLARANRSHIPLTEEILKPYVQPGVHKFNDVVANAYKRNVYEPYISPRMPGVGQSIKDGVKFFKEKIYEPHLRLEVPPSLKPKDLVTSPKPGVATTVGKAAEPAGPGPLRTIAAGAAVLGSTNAAVKLASGKPIEVHVNSAHPHVFHNASPSRKHNITFEMGDVSASLWAEPFDARMPWLLAHMLGSDYFSLPYVRGQNGLSMAEAPRVSLLALGAGLNAGNSDYAARVQAEFRFGNMTAPTQLLARDPTQSGKLKLVDTWGGITSQVSFSPLYVNVQPAVAVNRAMVTTRNISTFMFGRYGITPERGAFADPVRKNTQVKFDTGTINPGMGRAGEIAAPATREIHALNLFNDKPLITKPVVQPLALNDRSAAKFLDQGHLKDLTDNMVVVYDESHLPRAMTAEALEQHYAGTPLSQLGRPALLINPVSAETRIDPSKIIVVDNGTVRKLNVDEIPVIDANGDLRVVDESSLSWKDVSNEFAAGVGRPAYLSQVPVSELLNTPEAKKPLSNDYGAD